MENNYTKKDAGVIAALTFAAHLAGSGLPAPVQAAEVMDRVAAEATMLTAAQGVNRAVQSYQVDVRGLLQSSAQFQRGLRQGGQEGAKVRAVALRDGRQSVVNQIGKVGELKGNAASALEVAADLTLANYSAPIDEAIRQIEVSALGIVPANNMLLEALARNPEAISVEGKRGLEAAILGVREAQANIAALEASRQGIKDNEAQLELNRQYLEGIVNLADAALAQLNITLSLIDSRIPLETTVNTLCVALGDKACRGDQSPVEAARELLANPGLASWGAAVRGSFHSGVAQKGRPVGEVVTEELEKLRRRGNRTVRRMPR